MDLKVLIQIILLSVLTTSQAFQCPFYEELNGCKCYPKSQSIICDEKATKVPDLSRKNHFKTITLNSTIFHEIDFKGLTVDTLILIKNLELARVNPPISLQNLNIVGENNFNLKQFWSQINVSNILDITAQNPLNFQVLDTTIFSNLGSVKKIILKNNNISKISGKGLTNLTKLDEINLSNNKIDELSADCLKFSSGKLLIDLSHNQINLSQLNTSGLLKSNASLEAVYLSYNQISTLTKSSFESQTNKSNAIFLDNNPLKCEEIKNDIEWVFNASENWQRVLRQVHCVDLKKDLFSSKNDLFPIISTTITPTKEPVTPTKEPVTPSKEPVTPSKEPVTPSKEPVTPSKEPVTPSKEPVTPSKEPVTPSKEPVTPSKEPVTPSKEPVTPSKEPVT